MKILADQSLVNALRKKSDKVKNRFWVAVPYIGNLSSVRKIVGNKWINDSSIDVRLITDTNLLTNFNSDALRKFLEKGAIKNIPGLHAKVYIIDDVSFISSANLTNTAFSKRAEIGILLNKSESSDVINQYESWWKEGEIIPKIKLARKIKSRPTKSKDERAGSNLPIRNKLLADPGGVNFRVPIKYMNYDYLVEVYNDFASKYTATVNRVWPNSPLFMEVDAFLDFLYRIGDQPSNNYKNKNYRKVSEGVRLNEIRKYFRKFRKYADDDMLKWRKEGARVSHQFLSPNRINQLTKPNLRIVFNHINALNTFGFHKKNALEKNRIQKLRKSFEVLLHSKESLPKRFKKCSELKNIKESSMYEMLGLYYPQKYPLINNNSLSGLRFFGYDVSLK